jgi:hypothetical protein
MKVRLLQKYRMRQLQDSNLRTRNVADFKSAALTTRPNCLNGWRLPSTITQVGRALSSFFCRILIQELF